MSITALQLASFVVDLEDFFSQEKAVLGDIAHRAEKGGDFEDGLLLGAQSLRNLLEVEQAIDISLRRLEKALRPLQLEQPLTDIRQRELFSFEGRSFLDTVEEASAILAWRQMVMKSLRLELLKIGEEEIGQAYSENADRDSLARLERGLDEILSKGDS